MLRQNLSVLTFLFFLHSCDQIPSLKNNNFKNRFESPFQWKQSSLKTYSPPVPYTDPNCPEERQFLDVFDPFVVFQNGARQSIYFQNPLQTFPSLNHPFLKHITQGGQGSLSETNPLKGAQNISMCGISELVYQLNSENKFIYPNSSVQAAALGVLFAIEKSILPVLQLLPPSNLEGPELIMFPLIEGRKYLGKNQGEIFFHTDNAYYLHGKKQILILPSSRPLETNKFQGLWNFPAVMAHEVGHFILDHIFLTPNIFTSSLNESALISSCFNLKYQPTTETFGTNAFQGGKTQEEIAHMYLAFHEAFADLWAFLTISKDESLFKGLKCLEKTRNPAIQMTDWGENKILTPKIIKDYLEQKELDSIPSAPECKLHSKDPHYIGALLAHQLYLVLKQRGEDNDRQIELFLEWTQNLASKPFPLRPQEFPNFLIQDLKQFLDI